MKIKISISGVFIFLMCLLNFFTLQVSGQSNVNMPLYSLLCRAYIVVIYLMFLYYIYRSCGKILNDKKFGLVILMAVSAALSYFFNPNGTLYEWVVLLLCYLEIPLLYLMADWIDEDLIRSPMLKVYGVMLVLMYMQKAFINPIYDVGTGALTMGYSNSNRLAIYLLETACFIFLQAKIAEKRTLKIMFWGLMGILTYIIVLTQSRTCVLCMMFLWVMFFWENSILKIINKKILAIATVFPLAFVFIYLSISNKSLLINTIIYGKSLVSGRQYIYQKCLDALSGNWLFGNYAFCQFGNMHNFLLTMLATCGVVGLVLAMIFHWVANREILYKAGQDRVPRLCLLCLLVLYVSASCESAIYTNGMINAGEFLLILIFMLHKERKV